MGHSEDGMYICIFFQIAFQDWFTLLPGMNARHYSRPIKGEMYFSLFEILYCCSITVIPIFLHYSSLPYPPPLLHLIFPPLPIVLVHESFTHVSWLFLLIPPLPPSPLSSGHCQFVLYFHISGSILLACLFCWLGFTYRWDHMVFAFHCLAYFT